jgi:predicted membrane chloride channel (bestrophin family)
LCFLVSRIAAWPGPFSASVLLLLLLLHVCIAWSFALITRFRMWTALPDCLPLLFLGLGCGLHCLIVCPYHS